MGKIEIGDLVIASVVGQLPLYPIIPKGFLEGTPALYLGDVVVEFTPGPPAWLSYVLYSGTVLTISKEKLVKCTTIYAQA